MVIVSHDVIKNCNISPLDAYRWVKTVFLKKNEYILPPKSTLNYDDQGSFFNTMPCILPDENLFCVKVIARHVSHVPALTSKILLKDLSTGNSMALLDGAYITTLRTGAVAALAAETLAVKDYDSVGFWGLGNTAYATFDVLMAHRNALGKGCLKVHLLRYKDQAEKFKERFKREKVEFIICENMEEIVRNVQVLFSCVSFATRDFCEQEAYPMGILCVPIHTKGFQNCDLTFDRIFVDDTGHVKKFKYFNQFSQKNYGELSDVLNKVNPGRINAKERILSYNVGIGLHDAYFAKKIYEKIALQCPHIDVGEPTEKVYY